MKKEIRLTTDFSTIQKRVLDVLNNKDYRYYFCKGNRFDPKWLEVDNTGLNNLSFDFVVDNEDIGFYQVDIDRDHNTCEGAGFMIYPEHRGKGYAKEFLNFCVNFVLAERGFRKFSLETAVDNSPMMKTILSLGFTCVGTKKLHKRLLNGEYVDMTYFEMMKEDWEKQGQGSLMAPAASLPLVQKIGFV